MTTLLVLTPLMTQVKGNNPVVEHTNRAVPVQAQAAGVASVQAAVAAQGSPHIPTFDSVEELCAWLCER
jgi:hypothetical protein